MSKKLSTEDFNALRQIVRDALQSNAERGDIARFVRQQTGWGLREAVMFIDDNDRSLE